MIWKISKFNRVLSRFGNDNDKVPIVQLFDTRQQKGDCKTQKVGKTEPIDVIESNFVGVFRVRSHDHVEHEIFGSLLRESLKMCISVNFAAI
jgi:hypothetical protein